MKYQMDSLFFFLLSLEASFPALVPVGQRGVDDEGVHGHHHAGWIQADLLPIRRLLKRVPKADLLPIR